LNDEAVLLGALAAMAAGRTATETLGLSGELGCLLMGLSVAPISTVVFPKDEAAAATSPSMRELSPRASGGVRLSPRAADDAPHGGHGEAGGRTAEIVLPVRDLLIALFFASCGQHLSPGFMRELLGTLASLALLAMGLKFTIVALTLRCLTGSVPTGASAKTVALTAAGLAQISEVSFFIAARAKRQGLIGRETHFVLLAITSLSLAFAPLVWAVVRYWAPEAAPTRSIAIPRGSDRFVVEEES
jgi:Kef-type K+ transport system membrane component KefB